MALKSKKYRGYFNYYKNGELKTDYFREKDTAWVNNRRKLFTRKNNIVFVGEKINEENYL